MKAKVLLTAFALPAIFAACTNEELMEATQNQQPTQEIVGAKLISSGLSINVGGQVDSRLTEEGAWTLGDKLGLGWLNAQDDIKEVQIGGTNTGDQILYANNMFQKESEDGKFTTYGNVYEGFHFAYFQYERMNKIGEKTIDYTKNNIQKELWNTDKNNRALYLSPQVFLTEEDVDGDKLVTDKSFELQKVTNQLAVRATVGADIKEKDALAGMAINKVELKLENDKANQPIYAFVKNANLNPRKLPVAVYDEEEGKMVVSPEWTVANLMGTTSTDESKAIQPKSASSSIVTLVEGEFAGLTNNEVGVNLITFPTYKVNQTLAEKPVTIILTTGAGYFTVEYTKDAEEGTDAAKNNEAIEKLIALLTTGYGSDKITIHNHMGVNASLNININKSMFTPDYSNIKTENEWNQCVAVANALGKDDVEFTVTESFAFAGAIQTPEVENFSVATAADKAITVGTEAGVEWSNDIKVAKGKNLVINVAEGKVLNIVGTEAAPAVMNATSIVNKGIINVNEWAAVSEDGADALNNEDGRVIVEFNGFVYAQDNKEGTIAYVVENTTKENISKINLLMQGSALEEYAHVNTLIVKTDLDLNAVASEKVENNRYEASTPAKFLSSLAEINIELAGGSLSKVLAGTNNKVKNIVAVEGTNTLNLGVKVVKDVTVAKDATLTVANTENYDDKGLLLVDNMYVNGTLNVNKSMLTTNIYETKTGSIKVAENHEVFYKTNYQQDGSTQGTIEKNTNVVEVNSADVLQTALNNATDKSIIILTNSTFAKDGGSQAAFEISKTTDMKFWIVGGDNTTIKNTGANHGIRISNKANPETRPVINIQDVTIESGASREAVSAKYNITVNLSNVGVQTRGEEYAILLDNGNKHVDGKFYDGTRTIVNAYNVAVKSGNIIGLNALPVNLDGYKDNVSYAEFNYVGGNITSSIIEAQTGSIGTGNLFVNGEAIN